MGLQIHVRILGIWGISRHFIIYVYIYIIIYTDTFHYNISFDAWTFGTISARRVPRRTAQSLRRKKLRTWEHRQTSHVPIVSFRD